MKLGALVVPTMLLTIAMAGCTGGDAEPKDDFTAPPMENGAYVITLTPDFKFVPEKAKVPVGATVVWKNDGGRHNVAPDGHSAWTALAPTGETGEIMRWTAVAGEYKYFCAPHESLNMRGVLKVG